MFRKNKKVTMVLIIMTIICGTLFPLAGCVPAEPNTRETARELTFGNKSGVMLDTDDYFWYFFELDTETKIGLEGAHNDATFEIFSNDESESITTIRSNFWSRTLSSGKYYVKIVCHNGNLFGVITVNITLHNIQQLPDLPIDSEFSLDLSGSTKQAYYKTELDIDSDINVEIYKHPDLKVSLAFYYYDNYFSTSRLVFDYSDDFAVFEKTVQISMGECIVLIEYECIPANPKKSNIPLAADLTITINEQDNIRLFP